MKYTIWPVLSWLILNMALSGHLYARSSQTMDRGDGTQIHYYLNASEGTGDSLLVLIQGSDCNSVYHNPRIKGRFSRVLPDADILMVEKYGLDASLPWNDQSERADCPVIYIEKDSPLQRVQDYARVLNAVTKDGAYDRVVLLGGSEGAVVANLLASQLDYIDATVALNGGGRKFIDDVLHSIKSQSPSNDAYNEAANGLIGFSKHILNSQPFEIKMSGHGYAWWRSMFEIDQTDVLLAIDTPVLLIQAEKDQSVSVRSAMAQASRVSDRKLAITFKTYPDLDHAFKRADGSSGIDNVVQDIRLWLEEVKRQSGSM